VSHSAPSSIAVDLFLTVVFVIACRWIKRNPSSFLRYILFPFGGLNVERWPGLMLAIVRVCAVLGFFSFLLTFFGLLAPESLAHPTPAVLYSKFTACILISFFALKGTAEPAESYETPKFGTPSTKPSAAPKSAPAAAKSAPTMPKGMPTTPLAPAIPLAIVPAPAGNSAKSRVADVEAPPVPNRSYPLREPPPGVVSERLTFMVSTLMFAVVLMGFCYLLGITWLVITFLVFFSFAEVVLFFGRNAPVGTCPFCGGLIQRYNRVRPEPVRCEHCSEISKLENERLSPYNPNAVAETPIFRSPAFENGVWPNGCVQCGAPPSWFDDAQAVRYQARRLATPLVSSIYLPHPAARVTGVPYCERHREAIQVIPPKEMFAWTPWRYVPGFAERMEERRKAFLMWRSLPMMRRYLEANRRAKSAVSAGYREPNLLQKTVSAAFTKSETQGPSAAVPHTNPTKSGA